MKASEVKIGVVLSYVIVFLNGAISIFYTPFMTHMLGQSEFGVYSLVISIMSYLTILDFGFGNAVIVYTAKRLKNKDTQSLPKLHGMFLKLYVLISIITIFLGVILFFNLNNIFGQTMTSMELHTIRVLFIILIINLAITFPFSLYTNIIIAYEKFIFNKVLSIIQVVSNPLLSIPLLLFGCKSVSLALITTFTNITILLINYFYCKNKLHVKISFAHVDNKIFKGIFVFSFWIFLGQIIDQVNWNVDNFILGAICGSSMVAVFAVAEKFNRIYGMISSAIVNVLLPKVSKMEVDPNQKENFTDIFIKTGRLQFLIMMLILSGFLLFGEKFIDLLFGAEYHDAYYIACILMIPVSIPWIQNIGLGILQAKNKYQFRVIVYMVIAIGNIFLSIFLAKDYGGIGTAIGTGLSFIVGNFIIMNIYYHKVIKINIIKFWKNIGKMAIPIIILFILSSIVQITFGYINIWIYLLEIVVYISLYILLTYKFSMNTYEKALFTKFLWNSKRK